jgi:rRNA-processing protein FCF1
VEDVSPTTIANYFCHCKIRTSDIIHTQQGEVGPPTALIQELQHQVVKLPYKNPMDICNLFNYLEENNYMVASNDEDITNCIIEELRP